MSMKAVKRVQYVAARSMSVVYPVFRFLGHCWARIPPNGFVFLPVVVATPALDVIGQKQPGFVKQV